MTEERLEIGKYSNLSSSYHLLLCAVYEMERNESMYKVCTYVFVSHCVPFRESKAKKIISLHSKKHPPPPLTPPTPRKIQVLFTHPNQPAIKHFATLSPYRMKQQHPKK